MGSKDEIEKMVQDAPRYAEENTKQLATVTAKNALESYVYQLRNSVTDPKVSDKINASDKKKLEEEIESTISWIDDNESAEVNEFEYQRKELEKVASPIISKIYSSGDAGQDASAKEHPTGGSTNGPQVVEVD